MSETMEPQEDIKAPLIAVNRIFADEDFNCRGYIPPSSVLDLAKDIEANGLLAPISVQPYTDKPGYDFRIIQGHRRFTAISVALQWTHIPCLILEGMTELQSLLRNLNENLQRLDLNVVQEARALQRLKNQGLGGTEIARALRKDRSWVQTRLYVLDFPPDIQEEMRIGTITQGEMHQLHSLEPELWYEGVRQIKKKKLDAQISGSRIKKVGLKHLRKPKPETMLKAKRRTEEEIKTLLEHLMDYGIPNMATRTLAWATGEITTLDLLQDYKTLCYDAEGFVYTIPAEGIPGL